MQSRRIEGFFVFCLCMRICLAKIVNGESDPSEEARDRKGRESFTKGREGDEKLRERETARE